MVNFMSPKPVDPSGKVSPNSPYVRNFRYKLINPDNGKAETWTRATTFAKALSDSASLSAWDNRVLTKGLAMSPSMLSGLADLDVSEHKGIFSSIIAEAKELSGAHDGARRGTRMHELTEALDKGLTFDATSSELDDMNAYQRALAAEGVQICDEYIECFVAVPELKVCGKLDRIYSVPVAEGSDERMLCIGDVKTAKNIHYSWLEISIQLALYSMATHIWSAEADQWQPMPVVRSDNAIVANVLVDTGMCNMYDVDLLIGREAVEVARHVRALRARKDIGHLRASHVAGNPYARRIAAAASREELSAIWAEASACGEWTQDLESLGSARLKVVG